MARHSLIAPFKQFRGTVAGPGADAKQILYDDIHRGRVSRNWTKTPNPKTIAQIMHRTWIALCAQSWRALPAATAAAWRSLADQMKRTNALGYTYTLTGINVFYQVNLYRQRDGQAINTAPPPILEIPPPIKSLDVFSSAAGSLHIEATCTAYLDNCHVLLKTSPSSTNQSRLRRPCDLKCPGLFGLGAFALVIAGAIAYTDLSLAQHYAAGEYLGISFTPCSPGYLARAPWFIPLQLLS